MILRLLKSMAKVALVTGAAVVLALGWSITSAYAQCNGCKHGHSGDDSASAGHQHGAVSDDQARGQEPAKPPHGGQLTKTKPWTFEVVYQPKEIRVYLYGLFPQPETTEDVKGEITLQLRNEKRVSRLALRHVAPPAGEQDYLSASVDLSRVKDGDVTATIKLANLPLPNHPQTTFVQAVVVASKAKLQVVTAALHESDEAGVTRQRVCPVTGAELGSMGNPIKVLVGEQTLYLCCKGCLGKVRSAPEEYLRKAIPKNQAQ